MNEPLPTTFYSMFDTLIRSTLIRSFHVLRSNKRKEHFFTSLPIHSFNPFSVQILVVKHWVHSIQGKIFCGLKEEYVSNVNELKSN